LWSSPGRTGLPVDHEHVGTEHGRTVEQRRPEVLTLASTTLVEEGGEHPDHRHHGVGGVGHPEAEIQRRIAFIHRTRLELEAAGGLVERVEAAKLRQWPLGAVGVGVAVHEIRVARLEGFVVDAEACCGPLRHVVVDHVGDLGQAHDRLEPLGGFYVDGDIELAALASDEGHPSHPHAVTAYRFHLDDLGPQVGEEHRPEGSGQVLAKVEDDHTAQRAHDTSSKIPTSSR
jgi:hypothetical protein